MKTPALQAQGAEPYIRRGITGDFEVVVETIPITGIPTASESLLTVFKTHFVFNLKYKKSLQKFFEEFESSFFF